MNGREIYVNSNAISIQRKIIAVNLVFFLASFAMLQACSPAMATDSPLLDPQPVPQISTDTQSKSLPPNDMYLFMEIMIAFDGTGTLPMKFIDFPGYGYDPATGVLKSYARGKKISLTPSDWGFIGLREKRSGAMGGGTASQLITVDQLPFTVSAPIFEGKLGEYAEEINHIPVTLLTISMDGEVLVDIDGQQIALSKGEKWEQAQEMAVNNERFNGQLQVTFSVINYGWNARNLIDST